MSKTKQVLQIARDELAKTEGDTIPKDELLGTLDQLITAVPQAQAMDEQQLDIFITYMRGMHSKMDLLFNATILCGLGISKDMRIRSTIDQMNQKMAGLQNTLDRELQRIADPEGAAEQDKKDAEVRAAAASAMPGEKKPGGKNGKAKK